MKVSELKPGDMYLGKNGVVRRVEKLHDDAWYMYVRYNTVVGPARSVKGKPLHTCNRTVFAVWAKRRVLKRELPELRKAYGERPANKPVIELSDIVKGKSFTNGVTTRQVYRIDHRGSVRGPKVVKPISDVFYTIESGPKRGWQYEERTVDGKPGTHVYLCTAKSFRKWATKGQVKR